MSSDLLFKLFPEAFSFTSYYFFLFKIIISILFSFYSDLLDYEVDSKFD